MGYLYCLLQNMFDSKKSKTKKIKMYDILITYDINNDGLIKDQNSLIIEMIVVLLIFNRVTTY